MVPISCLDLTHDYGKKRALDHATWMLQPGRVLALLGRNGAGKTTTINILNGFLEPTSGRCELLGEDVRHLAPQTKARIGYLIEGHVQYPFFDVLQIERFYEQFYPRWDTAIYRHLIGKLDIAKGQKIGTFSCGQRSQVALGLVLAQNPDLIIFDDYSMGLDPGYRRLFVNVIHEYAADGRRSILLTSHIIQDLEGLVDDVIVYREGRVAVDMALSRLLAEFRSYSFDGDAKDFVQPLRNVRIEGGRFRSRISGFLDAKAATEVLQEQGLPHGDLRQEPMTLEDVFIALTGKY